MYLPKKQIWQHTATHQHWNHSLVGQPEEKNPIPRASAYWYNISYRHIYSIYIQYYSAIINIINMKIRNQYNLLNILWNIQCFSAFLKCFMYIEGSPKPGLCPALILNDFNGSLQYTVLYSSTTQCMPLSRQEQEQGNKTQKLYKLRKN